MKLEHSTYQKPLSLTGFGGGATSLNFAGVSGAPAGFVLTLNDTSTHEQAQDIKIGSDGSIYGCGNTNVSGCGDTAFIFKADASGNVKWQRYLCNNGSFYGMALDSSDNVIVTARSSGPYAGNVIKYNSSGVLQWQKKLTESNHYATPNDVGVDSSDNIYITGYLMLTSGSGTYRPLVAKYNSSGTLQWFRVYKGTLYGTELSGFYGTYNMDCYGGTVDSSGNVYITGRITAQSNSGAYASKINSSGTWQWTTFLKHGSQNPGSGIGMAIDVDSSGNVYICGNGTSPSESGNQGTDAFVAKFNSSGTYQWINFYGSTIQGDEAKGVVVDSSGYIYVTGVVNNGGSSLLALSITKFKSSPTGSGSGIYNNNAQIEYKRVIRNFGEYDSGSNYVFGNQITLDSDENVYVAGYTNKSTQNWGNSDNEIVIGKIPNDGSLTGTYSFGSSNWIYTDGEYIYNSYYLDTAAPSNKTLNGGNYVGNTNIVFADDSSSYTMTEATSTFTDATTSMTSAITLFE